MGLCFGEGAVGRKSIVHVQVEAGRDDVVGDPPRRLGHRQDFAVDQAVDFDVTRFQLVHPASHSPALVTAFSPSQGRAE